MMQSDDDRQLRSALKRLAPSVHEGQALERVMQGGRGVRRRHRYQAGGIAVLVVLLAAFGAAGIWWLARDLPSNPADQLPFLAASWPAADSVSAPLTALPVLSPQEMREVDVSGPGGWTLALDPEKDAGTIAEILTAYGQMTLTPAPEGGFTYPELAPDVTMALVPLEGQPLYVGMHAVMSSVSLEVWTPNAQGTALRGWISGEPLHALFRNYWSLANEAATTASSTTSTSATGPTGTVQPPPAAELDNIVVLFGKVGIEAPSVS
jgi:hypothetical protein